MLQLVDCDVEPRVELVKVEPDQPKPDQVDEMILMARYRQLHYAYYAFNYAGIIGLGL